MKRILILLSFGLGFLCSATGQELLRVQQAVELALENNYDIKLSQNALLVAQENKTYGTAGIHPQITADIVQNNSVQNTTQLQSIGIVRSLDNARNNILSYAINLGSTIFHGLAMFARYEKLQELET